MRRAQEEAARKAKARRRVVVGIGAVVIVGLLAAIAFVLIRAAGSDDGDDGGSGNATRPANLTSDGAIPIGEDSAGATVEIYFDYMCPACGAFEQANSEELDRLVQDGTAQLALRPISFLDDQSSGTEYSTRTANAIWTVADGAPDSVWAFHGALFANQPEEGSEGLTDEEIADIATEAGVPASVVDRFADGEYDDWVASATDAAFDSGVTGTPTVKIDGEVFDGDLYTAGVLTEAVEAAAGGAE